MYKAWVTTAEDPICRVGTPFREASGSKIFKVSSMSVDNILRWKESFDPKISFSSISCSHFLNWGIQRYAP
jgi:hypothetical protein